MKSTRSILAHLMMVFMLGCNIQDLEFDNIQAPDIDGLYAGPIGEATYTMSELLEEVGDISSLQEDTAGFYYLVYSQTASFTSNADIVNIGDVINQGFVNLPETPPVASNETIIVNTAFTFEYAPDQAEIIDSVFYLTGEIVLNASTTFSQDINFTITLTNTTDRFTGQPLSFSGFTTFSGMESLVDHKTFFTFQSGMNTFQVDVQLEIPLTTGQGIGPGETFDIEVSYLNQSFSEVHGKFGQDTIGVGGTVLDIPFFADLEGDGLRFDAPTIQLDFTNSFGLPVGILFGGLYSVDNNNGVNDTLYLEGPITQNPQVVAGAETVGATAETSITLNKTNSTLGDLLAVSPDQLGFDLQAVTNPSDANQPNFVLNNSSIETNILVTMPLAVQMEDLVREVSFNLGGGLDFNEADSAVLRVVTNNGMPFSAVMDVEIFDADDNLLFIAAENVVLTAPLISSISGEVLQPRNTTTNIPIGTTGIAALNEGSRLNLTFTLNTSPGLTANDIFVRIRSSDSLQIKVSAVAAVNYQFK